MTSFPGRVAVASLTALAVGALAAPGAGLARTGIGAPVVSAARAQAGLAAWPIQHVVVIYQENHSFDNVLGVLCATAARCNGARKGKLPDGTKINLSRATDLVPNVSHSTSSQATAIDGGKMDGFANVLGCTAAEAYGCYTQFAPSQVPNITLLAQTFAISDRTFALAAIPSWGAHIELVTSVLDGFTGDNPRPSAHAPGPGWGCDSFYDADWNDPASGQVIRVPSCIPDQSGFGPYRSSPVPYVPTLMDRLDGAGVSWRLYAGDSGTPRDTYGWSICPTFAECLFSGQAANVVPPSQVLTDAAAGTLPGFSVVLPDGPTTRTSQHNGTSMIAGDDWIGQVVQAFEAGPDWSSTAIFLTYDDCGCFYDHVRPPTGMGIRVPMVIVSPYAKPAFTDSNVASFASLLAFTEHLYGLVPLSSVDAGAYDYSGAFNFAQAPLAPVRMVRTPIPAWERRWVAAHPEVDGT